MPDNKKKRSGRISRWETIKTIFEETREVRNKKITVAAKMQIPIFINDDGQEKNGWETISLFISRDDKSIVYNYREAEAIRELLGDGLMAAMADQARCETRFQSWLKKKKNRDVSENKDRYTPKGTGIDNSGKTERKKKAGKAGEDYHRQKKRERAAKDRQMAHNMGAGSKKGK